jgi:predicted nucleic acid-binding protein
VTDAFDSDVLIYAANGEISGLQVRALLETSGEFLGSVVLLPEMISNPIRTGNQIELAALERLLTRIDLKDVDHEIAEGSAMLAAKYGLKAADAIHLATAVVWGAERFHTNNRKDFGPHITEVEVVWPG